ncbi:MAG TPA: hypothetical protein VGM30_10440 [Puia sp.]|jgi:hypothetical protein
MLISQELVRDPMNEFYNKKLYFSYSALKLLLHSPGAYKRKYITKIYEEKIEKHLIKGKVIHCLLLNNHLFDELFIVSPVNIPSGNNKIIVDRIFKIYLQGIADNPLNHSANQSLTDYSENILNILLEINLHQSLTDDKPDRQGVVAKTGNQKRLEKIFNDENLNYFEYLKIQGTRNVIDQETYDLCAIYADIIRNNKEIVKIMALDVSDSEEIKVINEFELRTGLSKYPFGIKGILDNVVFDNAIKVIRVNDFKTTDRPLNEFRDTIDFYKYWLQAVIYMMLVYAEYTPLFDNGWTFEFRFIVIDANQHVYPFLVKEKTLNEWLLRFNEVIDKANYHYTERAYDLPFEFSKGLVVL